MAGETASRFQQVLSKVHEQLELLKSLHAQELQRRVRTRAEDGNIGRGRSRADEGNIGDGCSRFEDGNISHGQSRSVHRNIGHGRISRAEDGIISNGHSSRFKDGNIGCGRSRAEDGNISNGRSRFEDANIGRGQSGAEDGNIGNVRGGRFQDRNIGHGRSRAEEGNISNGSRRFEDGNIGHGRSRVENGSIGIGCSSLKDGNIGHGHNSSEGGNIRYGHSRSKDGNIGHGQSTDEDGNIGHGHNSSEGGNIRYGHNRSNDGNMGHGQITVEDRNIGSGHSSFEVGNVGHGQSRVEKGNIGYDHSGFKDGNTGNGHSRVEDGSIDGNIGHGQTRVEDGKSQEGLPSQKRKIWATLLQSQFDDTKGQANGVGVSTIHNDLQNRGEKYETRDESEKNDTYQLQIGSRIAQNENENENEGHNFRRRKRKQESRRIQRANCESVDQVKTPPKTLFVENDGKEMEKLDMQWRGDRRESLGEVESKVSSEGEIEPSYATAHRDSSEFNLLTIQTPLISNSPKLQHGSEVAYRGRLTHRIGEIVAHELAHETQSLKGEARDLYQRLVNRIVDALTRNYDQDDGYNYDAVVKLENALIKERTLNKKLGSEVAILKDKLNEVLSFSQAGIKRECTYCNLVKEKLESEIDQPTAALIVNHSLYEQYGVKEMCEKNELSIEEDLRNPRSIEESKRSKVCLDSSCLRDNMYKDDEMPAKCLSQLSSRTEDMLGETLVSDSSQKADTAPAKSLTIQTGQGEREFEGKVFELEKTEETSVAKGKVSFQDEGKFTDENGYDAGRTSHSSLDVFFNDLKKLTVTEDDYIDLKCGCTSQKYGDTIGTLHVHRSGLLEVFCECSVGCCEKGKPMTLISFEKHCGRGTSRKWKDSIWVILGGQKLPFAKVDSLNALYSGHKALRKSRTHHTGTTKHLIHRDEFICCYKCGKERRFKRKSKEDCRLYHDALLNSTWECSNLPRDRRLSCEDEEEREARRSIRGCKRGRACPGCAECVCLGCTTCRFTDCHCNICKEFMPPSSSSFLH